MNFNHMLIMSYHITCILVYFGMIVLTNWVYFQKPCIEESLDTRSTRLNPDHMLQVLTGPDILVPQPWLINSLYSLLMCKKYIFFHISIGSESRAYKHNYCIYIQRLYRHMIHLYVYKPHCRFVCLSVCLSVCLFVRNR